VILSLASTDNSGRSFKVSLTIPIAPIIISFLASTNAPTYYFINIYYATSGA